MALPPALRKKLLLMIIARLLLLLQETSTSSSVQVQLLSSLVASQAMLTAFAAMSPSALVPRASPEVWAHPRQSSFTDTYLLGSYTAAMFKNRVRVSRDVFQHLCESLGPRLHKQSTNLREPISVETRVAATLYRLGHTCSAGVISDMFGVGGSTVSPMLREFVGAVLLDLKPLYIRKPETAQQLQKLADRFSKLRGIPNVIGAIDGSHIPVSKPRDWAADYYNRKGFYSILLQGTVDATYKFWDYDIGWAGTLHDYNLFKRTDLFKWLVKGDFGSYALLGDAAYQPRTYMLTPFLGSKEGLSREQYYWNFIQSSSRMPVECAFGILKMRWACLLLRLDLDIRFVSDVVEACLVLHNICRIHNDSFDRDWLDEVKGEIEAGMQRSRSNEEENEAVRAETLAEIERGIAAVDVIEGGSSRLPGPTLLRGLGSGPVEEGLVVESDPAPEDRYTEEIEEPPDAFDKGKVKRQNLAHVLFDADRRRKVRSFFGQEDDESDSDEEMDNEGGGDEEMVDAF